MVKRLRTEYAEELFRLTDEADKYDQLVQEAILIRDTLNDEEIQDFLTSYQVPQINKTAMLTRAFSKNVDPILMNFLNLIVDNQHEEHIEGILSEYIDSIKRHQGRLDVKVVSAIELKAEQLQRLEEVLVKKTKKKLRMTTEIDPSLMGGFYLLMEGKIYDATVETQLNDIKQLLMREEVANGSKSR